MADLSILVPPDSLHISEQVTPRRYGDATPPAQITHVTDTLTARRYGDATPAAELPHVADTVTAALNLSATVFGFGPVAHAITPITVTSPTTPAINILGADLVVVTIVSFTGTPASPSDGVNTFTPLTAYDDGILQRVQTFYCARPTTSASYQVTTTAAVIASISVEAWRGSATSPFDRENGTALGSGTTVQPGSVTPAVGGALLLTSLAYNVTGLPVISIDQGFAIDENVDSTFTLATASKVQVTAAAQNPTWTSTRSLASADASIAVFLPSTTEGRAPDEHLTCRDSVTAVLVEGDRAVTLTETVHVRDGGITTQDGITRLEGVLHVTDTLTAVMGTAPGGDLSTGMSELTHVSDPLAVTLTPLAAVSTDTIHVTDTASPALLLLLLQTLATEVTHVSDTATPAISPIAAALSETIHVTDLTTAALDAVVTTQTETVHVSDAVTAGLTPLLVTLTETTHATDTATAVLGAQGILSATLTETIHVGDPVTASLTSAVTATETVQVFLFLT